MTDLKIIIGNKKYSSWSLRGWLAVKLSGLDFDEVKLSLDTPEFYQRIKDYSPTNCVPVLHHGEAIVWDSLAIIDYIDRLCPTLKLWPDDMTAFAHAKAISCEMHSGFAALRNAATMNIGTTFKGLKLSDAVAKDVARIDAIWSECRAKFGTEGDFLFGGFSAADIMFAPVIFRFETYDLPRSDCAADYITSMLNHPAMQNWVADALAETTLINVYEFDPTSRVLGE